MARKTNKRKAAQAERERQRERDPDIKVTQDAAVKKKSVGPFQFAQQVRAEGSKVTWTSRNETLISTLMVLVMVAIMSAFFFFVDWVLRFLIQFVLSL